MQVNVSKQEYHKPIFGLLFSVKPNIYLMDIKTAFIVFIYINCKPCAGGSLPPVMLAPTDWAD